MYIYSYLSQCPVSRLRLESGLNHCAGMQLGTECYFFINWIITIARHYSIFFKSTGMGGSYPFFIYMTKRNMYRLHGPKPKTKRMHWRRLVGKTFIFPLTEGLAQNKTFFISSTKLIVCRANDNDCPPKTMSFLWHHRYQHAKIKIL